jgi:hypothetical protein
MRKNYIYFLLFSLILSFFTSKLFAQNIKNLQKEAAKAVDVASACYRSLPSHAQSGGTVKTMLDARTSYNDAVKYLNMNENQRSFASAFFNNAIAYSNVILQIGRAYGSKSC